MAPPTLLILIVIKLINNKKRVYSVSKRDSVNDSSINDTFFSDANNSVMMNNKLNEYRKINVENRTPKGYHSS